jgi:hypothetical protein
VVMGVELLSLPELNLMQPAESFLRAALTFSLVGSRWSWMTGRRGMRLQWTSARAGWGEWPMEVEVEV